MAQIEAVKRLCERELKDGVEPQNSWHFQYRRCAYIYIGNFERELSEGDIITAFSQFGEVVDINLIREEDGKSKGFCFLAFEDQRSTVLAIDNMNGYHLYKRALRVDHAPDYKPGSKKVDGMHVKYEPTGAEGRGLGVIDDSQRHVKGEASGIKDEPRVKKES